MGRSFLESTEERPLASSLWVQALAEATEDEEVARYLRTHMGDVHRFVAAVIRRAQERKGLPADRDPDAEAWIFIALGLLSMAERCVGTLAKDAWPAIRAARVAWLTGRSA